MPHPGESGRQHVADVAVDVPLAGLQAYAVPADLLGRAGPGAVVRVPFGRSDRVVDGLCIRVTERPWDQSCRPILEVQPGPAWLTGPLLELGLWVSEYYVCSAWRTFAAVLPIALRAAPLRKVRLLRATGAAVPGDLAPKQAAVLAALAGGERARSEVLAEVGGGPALLRTLRKRGLIETVVAWRPCPREPFPRTAVPASAEDAFELTAGQRAALGEIVGGLDAGFGVFLLFGVPGSGKTEVYVRAIRAVLGRGRQAILLIPEIALATQIVERLARRFERVAVLHSQLPPRRRQDTLAAIAAGEVDVVIGTRTAVFAPCPRLGLMVVDEEQEGSFKNLAAPYYHARDVAIKRGQLEGVPVVLGSATPALETWHNALHLGHYRLLRLPERVPGAEPPEVRTAVHGAAGGEARRVLGPALRAEIRRTLADADQVVLLHNRRGYARYLRCRRCGLEVRCERCGVRLVFHRPDASLRCHHCGSRASVPAACLDNTCGGPLEQAGSAIQRLEQELRGEFPTARLLRLDSDTMRRRADYEAALAQFEAGAADVLLGTQMVAKGLDFPRVRLVGVIDADAALALPDFRAAERAFQLIVQVVGRAGRRTGRSLAIVQTAGRPPPVIAHALRLDYEAFAAAELAGREALFYPPAARLIRLVCADARPGRAREAAERLATGLRARAARLSAEVRVDDAEECVIRRLREMVRWQVFIRGPRGVRLQSLLTDTGRERLIPPPVQRFTIDVDAIELL